MDILTEIYKNESKYFLINKGKKKKKSRFSEMGKKKKCPCACKESKELDESKFLKKLPNVDEMYDVNKTKKVAERYTVSSKAVEYIDMLKTALRGYKDESISQGLRDFFNDEIDKWAYKLGISRKQAIEKYGSEKNESLNESARDDGLEYSLPDGTRIKGKEEPINEETKTPEQIEMEHKETAEWFLDKILTLVKKNTEKFDEKSWDGVESDVKKLMPDYFKKIVGDHQREFKNYYEWLIWMEGVMKKYKTPTDMLKSLYFMEK